MFIDLGSINVAMKIVYELSKEVLANPQSVADTHALTLDESRPEMGLRGRHGLYATEEWWDSIYQCKMETHYISGIVIEAYVAGQDHSDYNNEIDLRMADGSIRTLGIYVNNETDAALFQPGCRVDVAYVLDELKAQPSKDGGINYLKIVLEMAVSLEPIAN
jgi:hypothetical protein